MQWHALNIVRWSLYLLDAHRPVNGYEQAAKKVLVEGQVKPCTHQRALCRLPQNTSSRWARKPCRAWCMCEVPPQATLQVLSCSCVPRQAVDLSALGAQAAVGVERARAAAREQLAAALGQRPRLAVRLELDGPKVAVPVPATDTTGARMRQTLILMLSSIRPSPALRLGPNGPKVAVPVPDTNSTGARTWQTLPEALHKYRITREQH